MSLLRHVPRVLFAALLVPVAVLAGCQSRLIYHPQPYPAGWVEQFERGGGARVVFSTSQGEQTAFYRPPVSGATTPRLLWLCFAGNGSLALSWHDVLDRPHPDDAFLMVDYPGYGLCAGKPTPNRARENACAAHAAVLDGPLRGARPPVALAGHSLGAAVALLAAQDAQAERVVLVSPFTSMVEMGNRVLFPPLGLLTTHRYDNVRALAALQEPLPQVVIFHGERDEIIPTEMGQRLAAQLPDAARFIPVRGAGHNDVLDSGADEIAAAMNAPVQTAGPEDKE